MASMKASSSLLLPNFEFLRRMPIKSGRFLERFVQTMGTLFRNPGASIAQASADKSEANAIYSLFQNENFQEELVLESYRSETLQKMKQLGEKAFLCVQDTSDVSFANREKTPNLGNYNREATKGLLVHTALCLTTEGLPLGMLHQKIWARELLPKEERKVSRPYEEKESYKWTEAARASALNLPPDVRLIHVGDREADFFEYLHTLEADGQQYVIRAKENRILSEGGSRLFGEVRNQPAAGELVVSIPRDTRNGHPAREAKLALRFLSSTVQVTAHLKKKEGYLPLPVTVVHACEVDPPSGQEPIEWFLLTNVSVSSADEAGEKVAWYVQRWKIERFHYILKSGCNVEKLQARDGNTLKKLLLCYSIIAIQLQYLTYIGRQNPDLPCTVVMEEEEWKVLHRIAYKTKQLPPTTPTVHEMVMALAKLGGFLGSKSKGEPGAKVLWRGLQAFRAVYDTYRYLL